MNKFIMLIGLPGVGKDHLISSVLKYIYPNAVILSSDDIRAEVFNDVNDQKHNGEVFTIMKKRTLDALNSGHDVIYNATNINARKRVALLNELPKCERIAYLLLADIDLILYQNSRRDRNVPEDVINRMYKSFQMPSYSEGFDDIIISVNKDDIYAPSLEYEMKHNDICNHDNPHHTLTCGAHCRQAEVEIIKIIGQHYFIDGIDYRYILQLAACYHDLGKYKCKVFDKEKGVAHFYGHEYVSAYDFLTLSNGGEKFYLNSNEALLIANLINDHMSYFSGGERVEKIAKQKGSTYKELLHVLHMADLNAH